MKHLKNICKKNSIVELAIKCVEAYIVMFALTPGSLRLIPYEYATGSPSESVVFFRNVFTILESIESIGIAGLIVWLAILLVLYSVREIVPSFKIRFLSCLFALFYVLGISYRDTGTWSYIIFKQTPQSRINISQFTLAVICGLGFYFAFLTLFRLIKKLLNIYPDVLRNTAKYSIEKMVENRPFVVLWIIVFLLELPYIIAFYPGTFEWDTLAQIAEGVGINSISNKNPVFGTQIIRLVFENFRRIGLSDNASFFFLNFLQFIIQITIIAYAFSVMNKMKAPYVIRWASVVFWAVWPMFPGWGYTMGKDSIYYNMMFLSLVTLLDIIYNLKNTENCIKIRQIILLCVSAVGVSLFRHEGKYFIIPTLFIFLLVYRKLWKLLLPGLICSIAAVIWLEAILIPRVVIDKDEIQGYMSKPLLMMSRGVATYYDDFSDEDIRVIVDYCGSQSIEDFMGHYDRSNADAVLKPFEWYNIGDPNNTKAFWLLFAKVIKNHPTVVMQTLLDTTLGFYFPEIPLLDYDPTPYFKLGSGESYSYFAIDVSFNPKTRWLRQIIEHSCTALEHMPIFELFYRSGSFVWLTIVCFAMMKKHDRRKIFFFPMMFVLLVGILGPINPCLRYILPVVIFSPFLVLLVMTPEPLNEDKFIE